MKLSIITVCFNDLENLKSTLASLWAQTFKDFELWVIDGASKDGTAEYLKSIADPRLHFISEKDSGIFEAMNKGIPRSTGEYLYFLNAGDLLFSDEALAQFMAFNATEDFLYADVILKYDGHSLKREYPSKLNLSFWYLSTLCHQACFFRRSLLEALGGYEVKFRFAADFAFFARVWASPQYRLRHLSFVVAIYDMSGQSAQHANLTRVYAEFDQIRRWYFKGWRVNFLRYRLWLDHRLQACGPGALKTLWRTLLRPLLPTLQNPRDLPDDSLHHQSGSID